MGSGDHKNLLNFHFHLLQHHHHQHGGAGGKKEVNIPKGCVAIMVGQGEERQKFIVPVMYINHPLFMQLLREAEEEYGFDHKGPINIPCHVEEFRHVQGMIDKEHHDIAYGHHNNHILCFRV